MRLGRTTTFCLILISSIIGGQTTASALSLDDLTGTWQGQLQLPRRDLPLVFHLSKVEGDFSATLDSPAQGATGIPVTDISLDGDSFSFSVPSIGGRYKGTLDQVAREIKGEWSQGAVVAPLTFRHVDRDPEVSPDGSASSAERPQTPKPPFPYQEEELVFPSLQDGVSLAGTLTVPDGTGPFSAVVLVTGSGPQDRDETIAGHKPFRVIADYLARRGVAVLRFDDRGVGASKGNFRTATTHDFARDAAGALNALRKRENINSQRVGYLGHSEGGVVAILAHEKHEAANFIGLLATPILPYPEYIPDQVRALALASGAGPAVAEARVKTQRSLIEAALTGETPQQTRAAVERKLIDLGVRPDVARRKAAPFGSPWMFALLRLDPRVELRRIQVPVLGLWGGSDIQVDADKHHAAAKAALASNPAADLRILQGLNHLLQPAQTGAVSEYAEIEITIAPRVLRETASWLSGISAP